MNSRFVEIIKKNKEKELNYKIVPQKPFEIF